MAQKLGDDARIYVFWFTLIALSLVLQVFVGYFILTSTATTWDETGPHWQNVYHWPPHLL